MGEFLKFDPYYTPIKEIGVENHPRIPLKLTETLIYEKEGFYILRSLLANILMLILL